MENYYNLSCFRHANAKFDPIIEWPKCDFRMILVENAVSSAKYIENETHNSSKKTLSDFVIISHHASLIIFHFVNTTGADLQYISVLRCSYNLTSLMLTHWLGSSIICYMNCTNTINNLDFHWNHMTLYWSQYTTLKYHPWKTIPLIIMNLIQIWIFK